MSGRLLNGDLVKVYRGTVVAMVGGDFRFETTFARHRDALYIRGGGDPSLQVEDIESIAASLADRLDGVERIVVDETHVGVRDRSWGIRSVGEQPAGPPSRPQFFWIWCPTVFEDACTHFALNHESNGRPWHQSGAVVPRIGADEPVLYPGRVQRAETAEVDIEWQTGTRWAQAVTTRLGVWNGDPVEVTYEPLTRFQMSGIGYLHPEWNHGRWIGEAEATRDAIVLDDVNPLSVEYIHVQALCRARWGSRIGTRVVEQLVIGPHEPSGLAGILDGARSESEAVPPAI